MKKKILYLELTEAIIISFLLLTLSFCSPQSSPQKIDSEEILNQKELHLEKKAKSLYTSLFPSTLRAGESISVKNISYLSPNKMRLGDSIKQSLGVCAVNFANNNGFAIMTTGNVVTPIAIVNEGNFTFNQPIATVRDSILYGVIGRFLEGLDYNERPNQNLKQSDRNKIQMAGYKVIDLIEHKLKTSLNQRGPYFFPYRPTDWAGCVPVAITQILIYYKAITWEIKGRKVNWKGIEDECVRMGGEPSIESPYTIRKDLNEVLWWVGLNSGADYKEDGTGTFSYRALNLIRKNGYNAPKMYAYDINKLRQALQEDKLIYMDGGLSQRYFLWITWADDAHAWVADGYAKLQDEDNSPFEMVHINWGWGKNSCNGYFIDNIFDTSSEFQINTNSLRNGEANKTHYKYNIEMTPVSPK